MFTKRAIRTPVEADLADRKMAFIGGPRQVGKTTLALDLLGAAKESHPGYLSWDNLQTRQALLRGELPAAQPRVVLDEIHKFARWRNLIKGFYDTRKSATQFIVTGSARLDYYRKGGDSLQGRYHYFRLHPFSLCELTASPTAADVDHLLCFGGFPEPFLHGDEKRWRRWQRERASRVLREDLTDLEHVKEVSLIELLAEALPERVGSPLSIKSLREDLQVSHETVERWVSILERLYFCFRILPFGAPRLRAVKKEKKLYFWDWSQSPDGGARFENLVASQLLKYCHWREDVDGHTMELRFFRDTDKREYDFVVLQDRKALFAVECKTGEKTVSPVAAYLRERSKITRFYQVHLGRKDYGDADTGARVLPFATFCRELDMP